MGCLHKYWYIHEIIACSKSGWNPCNVAINYFPNSKVTTHHQYSHNITEMLQSAAAEKFCIGQL